MEPPGSTRDPRLVPANRQPSSGGESLGSGRLLAAGPLPDRSECARRSVWNRTTDRKFVPALLALVVFRVIIGVTAVAACWGAGKLRHAGEFATSGHAIRRRARSPDRPPRRPGGAHRGESVRRRGVASGSDVDTSGTQLSPDGSGQERAGRTSMPRRTGTVEALPTLHRRTTVRPLEGRIDPCLGVSLVSRLRFRGVRSGRMPVPEYEPVY